MRFERFLLLAALCSGAAPALATDLDEPTEDGILGEENEKLPNILIVRVGATGDSDDLTQQDPSAKSEVFPLSVDIERKADGTVDTEKLRARVLELMQTAEPVKIDDVEMDELDGDLQKAFVSAEEQTADDTHRFVAWRGYGGVRGYRAGVVAYNRSYYRGYYPGYTYPYYGYYNYYTKHGVAFNYHYGVYRRSPSYHYYGYYRYR